MENSGLDSRRDGEWNETRGAQWCFYALDNDLFLSGIMSSRVFDDYSSHYIIYVIYTLSCV